MKRDCPPRYLELELTESILMPEAESRRRPLKTQAMGVQLAIDDFGTAIRPQLSQSLPHRHAENRPVLRARHCHQCRRCCHRQRRHRHGQESQAAVIAEGVETREQLTSCKPSSAMKGSFSVHLSGGGRRFRPFCWGPPAEVFRADSNARVELYVAIVPSRLLFPYAE